MSEPMYISLAESIHDIPDWQQCLNSDYPFIQQGFLAALEDSGCTSVKSGWQPQHLQVYGELNGQRQLLAVMPMYLKSHSYGEYVFDWAWADAYQRHGLAYYPKLLAAIPFTPASGPRLCIRKGTNTSDIYRKVATFLKAHCQQNGISGWHGLFPTESDSEQWLEFGFARRSGCQFHWHNMGYKTFDDFLARFNSRKRKNLKKERRGVTEQGVYLQRLVGDQISEEDWQQFYYFYHTTYLKRSGGSGYLNHTFFRKLAENCGDQLLMVKAIRDNNTIAAALCFFDRKTLYGRYWGCKEEISGLHFEACYYQGIEFAIERGLSRFDPGAQGEHKIQRGFEPTITQSNHWLAEPAFRHAVEDFLQKEHDGILDYQQSCRELLPFKEE